MLQVEPEEGIAERQVTVFAPVPFPLRPLRLAQVLLGRERHHVQFSGFQFQKHGRGIGDNPVHHLIQIGTALEIRIRGRKGKHGTGVPLGKPVRTRADGLAGHGGGHDILPLKHVLGQNGPHPCHQGAGERLGITHLERQPPGLLEGFNGQEVPGIGRGRLGIDHELIGELHIVRRQRHAVLPADIVAQDEAEKPAALKHLIGRGGPRDHVQILVVLERSHIQEPGDLSRGGIGRHIGDEVGRLADGAHQDTPSCDRGAVREGRRFRRKGHNRAKRRKKQRPTGEKQNQQALFHTHSGSFVNIFSKMAITYLRTLENRRFLAYNDNIRLVAYASVHPLPHSTERIVLPGHPSHFISYAASIRTHRLTVDKGSAVLTRLMHNKQGYAV